MNPCPSIASQESGFQAFRWFLLIPAATQCSYNLLRWFFYLLFVRRKSHYPLVVGLGMTCSASAARGMTLCDRFSLQARLMPTSTLSATPNWIQKSPKGQRCSRKTALSSSYVCVSKERKQPDLCRSEWTATLSVPERQLPPGKTNQPEI